MNKNKKRFRIVVYLCLYIILIGMFVYLGKRDYGTGVVNYTDAEKFNIEYPEIPDYNNFKYLNAYNLDELLKNGTGIVFIGFSSNDWSQYYVKYLYSVLKNRNLSNLYYYDALKDKTRQNKYYLDIVSSLSNYLYQDDRGNVILNTPIVIFIKDGKVIYYDDETAISRNNVEPSDYWTDDRINAFETKISSYLDG